MLTNPKTGGVSFMKNLILYAGCLILFGCEELPFTNEDITASTKKSEVTEEIKELDNLQTETESKPPVLQDKKDIPVITEDEQTDDQIAEDNPPEENPFLEKEITLISEDLELREDTVIQNRKVVLDMAAVKTFEHNLFIIAEEFVSNHSVIRNFPEDEKAKKFQNGKNGGNILIEAERAIGELQIVLNGEEAGRVPKRNTISKAYRERLRGQKGRNGQNAVYRTFCRTASIPLILQAISIPIFSSSIPIKRCRELCVALPTKGEDGGRGLEGVPGFDGKNGGDSGSFHLKAFEFSDFHLVNIKKNPGAASKGGKGSSGGYGGKRGRNGIDSKGLCNYKKISQPSSGDKGRRGSHGEDGRDGNEGKVCIEKLIPSEEQEKAQREVKIVCEERGEGRNCREALDQEKENTICY